MLSHKLQRQIDSFGTLVLYRMEPAFCEMCGRTFSGRTSDMIESEDTYAPAFGAQMLQLTVSRRCFDLMASVGIYIVQSG